jgi:hypothetical protein
MSMYPVNVLAEHARLLCPLDTALCDWLVFMRSLDTEERASLASAVQCCVPQGPKACSYADFEWLRDTLLEFIDAEESVAHKAERRE